MLADDGHADAETQTGAAPGALGGEEGVENLGEDFRPDAGAVVLNGGENTRAFLAKANLDAAGRANFADGLFGVADQIEEHLDELVGIADGRGNTGSGMEVDLNGVAAKRMLVELQSAINDGVKVEGLLLRRGGAGEFEKVLDDASGAASLAMSHFELALGVFIGTGAIAEKFAGAKNSGEGIVEFVSDAGEHLSHGGEFFGLDELLFEPLHFGDVAARDDYAFNLAVYVEERTEVAAQPAPFALLVADAKFDGAKIALTLQQIVE